MKFRFLLLLVFALSPAHALAQRSDLFLSNSDNSTAVQTAEGQVITKKHYGSYASELKQKRLKADASLQYHGALAELPNIEKEMEKKENFQGPIERLLKAAGEDPSAAQNKWQDFESIAADDIAKQSYFESAEWKIRQELSRPIAKRKVFGDRLSDVEQTINSLNTKEKELDQEYGEKSRWAPKR